MAIIAAVNDGTDRTVIEEGRAPADAFEEELHVVHVRDRDEIGDAAGSEESMLEVRPTSRRTSPPV